MHSRIFELSQEPIEKEDFLTESGVPEWFCYSVADYVDTVDDDRRLNSIEWLKKILGDAVSFDDEKQCFTITNPLQLFVGKHKEFIEAAKRLQNTSLEDFAFSYDTDMDVYRIEESFNDKYGFYFYTEDDGLITMDKFMRWYGKEGNEKGPFYIGGVIDYHS